MPASPKPVLANFLESFFAMEDKTQVKAISVLLVLAFEFWFISLDKLPTKAEALVAARQSAGRGVVVRTSQNARGEFDLDVMGRDNCLIKETFWAYYYPLTIAADTANQLLYKDWQRLSLAAYAQVDDSLMKKPGKLFVQVKRGATIRTFYYRNPYQ